MSRSGWGARAGWAGAAVLASSLLLHAYGQLEGESALFGFVALVPFLLGLERLRARPAWHSAALGAVMAAGYEWATQAWFAQAVQHYTRAPLPVCLGLLVIAAPLLAPQFVAAALAYRLAPGSDERAGWWLPFTAAGLAFLASEWALPRLFGEALGLGLQPSRMLRQVAELGGPRALTLLVWVGNGGVLALVHAWQDRRRRDLWLAVTAAALLAAAAGFGLVRRHSVERELASARRVRMGIVQANLTHYAELADRLGTYDAALTILRTHEALSEQLLSSSALDALVWPETVYPTTFGTPQSEEGAELDQQIVSQVDRWKVPLIFGTYDRDAASHEFNAAMLLAPAHPRTSYRKVNLFPLTEWVPPWMDGPRFRLWFPWTGTWKRGGGPELFELTGADGRRVRLGPLICYDLLSEGYVGRLARLRPELLVNLSNDSWFGGTAGTRLHLAVASLRSVETGLAQVRATNSGISASVDPLGDVLAQTPDDERAVLVASLPLRDSGSTWAVRLGDVVGPLSALALAAMVLASALRRPRATRAP